MEPVVSYEHDDGAVRQAVLLHRCQGPADLVVHEADGGVVCPPELPGLHSITLYLAPGTEVTLVSGKVTLTSPRSGMPRPSGEQSG